MEQDLQAFWEAGVRTVDEALDALIPSGQGVGRLHESMRYSLFAGGKRLRPLLAMAACEAAGGTVRDAVPAACALELVHTYSLIHDDLPAMDDDDYRRGKPTNHRVYGEALAILAGDALLTLAFSALAKAPLSAEIRVRLIEELSDAAGKDGMVGGQVMDVDASGAGLADPARLADLHRRKTGALIVAAVRMGGICAGAGTAVLDRLTAYGRAVGLAYQIVDDLLDVAGDTAFHKLTWPAVYGVEGARRDVERLTREALDQIGALPGNGRYLDALARFLATRER
ncbi:MAG: polyprenyl synthetase family protein [Kyrpidia sp.]|nr:polyprenyl synthetase family protein [Kyrpidia sp.]